MKHKTNYRTIFIGLLMLSFSLTATAQITWNGTYSSVWNYGPNWSSGTVPTATDNVIIPPGKGTYPNLVNGTTPVAVCRDLTFTNGSPTGQTRITFHFTQFINVFGTVTNANGYSTSLLGSNGYLRMVCQTGSPSAVTITGDLTLRRLDIVKTCTGYTADIPSGTDVTIVNQADISGCTLTVEGNLFLAFDDNFSTCAFISQGVASGNVHVRAAVANASEGDPQRYHLLGNPITDNKPYNHLANLPGHSPSSEIDFSLSNYYVASTNDWGHHMYNPNFTYPPKLGNNSYALNGMNLPAKLNLDLGLGYDLIDCDPWPSWVLYSAYYTGNSQAYNPEYLNDNTDCNHARTSQTPIMMYYDESEHDPARPATSGALLGQDPSGNYGYKGIVDNTTTFSPLQGYFANFGPTADRTNGDNIGYIDWMGTVNDGTLQATFTRSTDNDADQVGWQLLGNPYPCPMDLHEFYVDNSSHISNYIEVFDGNVGDCDDCGNQVSVNVASSPFIINIGQGFWVRLTSAGSCTLEANNSQRSAGLSSAMYRKATPPQEPNTVELKMSSNKYGSDKITLQMGDQKALGFKEGEDAVKRFNFTNSLYSYADNYRVSINQVPMSQTPQKVDLGMVLQQRDKITLTASQFSVADSDYEVWLQDKVANRRVRINESFSYSFIASAGPDQKRFAVEFVPAGYEEKSKSIPPTFSPSHSDGGIQIFFKESFSGEGTYSIADASGRNVGQGSFSFENGKGILSNPPLDGGFYLITLSCQNRPTVTQKLVVNR